MENDGCYNNNDNNLESESCYNNHNSNNNNNLESECCYNNNNLENGNCYYNNANNDNNLESDDGDALFVAHRRGGEGGGDGVVIFVDDLSDAGAIGAIVDRLGAFLHRRRA